MAHQTLDGAGFVMDGQLVDNGLAGLVEADNFDLGTLTPELQHHGIQRRDAGDVPDMRT